jgi:hypothetical protein
MTLIGPVYLALGSPGTVFSDDITAINQSAPAPVVLPGINRDFSDTPKRGHAVTLTGVQRDLTAGTLWRYLWDNSGDEDVPILWSSLADGDVYFQGIVTSLPDPSVGGAANQHGTFDVTLTLVSRPTIVAAPA